MANDSQMPQLARGGKHVYAWSLVGKKGRIRLPSEAILEYGLDDGQRLIVRPGSRTSGGFSIGSPVSLRMSPIGTLLDRFPHLARYEVPEGQVVDCGGRPCCWIQVRNAGIQIPLQSLARYSVSAGDWLLVVRGSGLALGLIVRGPIVGRARRHRELTLLEPP